jgi:hypothetical protein
MEYGMIKLAHFCGSRIIDGVSFGAINAIQLRAKAGLHSAQEFQNYTETWKGASLEDYYKISNEADDWDLENKTNVTFKSPHPTGYETNNSVHIRIWPGPNGLKSPAMILLHGFMSVSDVGYKLWAKHLNELGWTAVFYHLPFHYKRCSKGTLSGELAISGNIIQTAETIRQGVKELRVLCRTLKNHGATEVGCWATSYGGWLASLLCVTESALSTAWLVEPIVDVHHVLWSSPAAASIRLHLKRKQINREMVRVHHRLVCPSYHQPLLNAENILLVAGAWDRIAPPSMIRKLNEHWSGSHYAEIQQGHVGYQLMPASWRIAREKMKMFQQKEKKKLLVSA